MIGKQSNDVSFSTIKGKLAAVFNTDGVERDAIDPEEARKAFDFTIEKRESYDATGRKIPGHFHLVRNDTMDFIPSSGIGQKFVPVQHGTVYDEIVTKILPAMPELKLETVGTIHGCGTGIVVAKMGEDFHIKGDDSPMYNRLMFSNPCNGTGSLIMGFTSVRLFCQNQIPAALKQAKESGFNIHHTKSADVRVCGAVKAIESQVSKVEMIRQKAQFLASRQVNEAFIKHMLDKLIPNRYEKDSGKGYTRIENMRSDVLTQFDGGETAMSIKGDSAWKLFNSFTFPIYNPETTDKRMDMAEIAYTGAVGSRALKVRKIFNEFVSEAESLPPIVAA